jgi:hypothetical protein
VTNDEVIDLVFQPIKSDSQYACRGGSRIWGMRVRRVLHVKIYGQFQRFLEIRGAPLDPPMGCSWSCYGPNPMCSGDADHGHDSGYYNTLDKSRGCMGYKMSLLIIIYVIEI